MGEFVDPDNGSESFVDPDKAAVTRGKKDPMGELSDMSVPRQVASGALGGPETVLSMASSVPAMAAGGIRGLTSIFLGEGLDTAAAKSAETADDLTYEPRTAAGKVFTDKAGKLFHAMGEEAGEIEAAKARALGLNENLHRTGGEFLFNAVTTAGPIAGMRPKRAPKAAPEAPVKPGFEFVDPDQPATSQRNKPESQELYQPTELKPGEFISEDGRRLVQEPYDPGIAPKLTEQERFGPRERGPMEERVMEFDEWNEYRPTQPLEMRATKETQSFENRALRDALFDGEKSMVADQKVRQDFRDYPAVREQLRLDVAPNAVRSGLEVIRDTSKVPFYRELSKKLLEDPTYRPDFEISHKLSTPKTWGEYDPGKYSIRMNPAYAGSEYVFLHENIHARTHSIIERVVQEDKYRLQEKTRGRPISESATYKENFEHLAPAVRKIRGLYAELHEKMRRDPEFSEIMGPEYGTLNMHEFIAEGFTNPDFQAKLTQMKVPKERNPGGTLKNYWDSFVDAVAKLFGFDRNSHSFLSELLRAGAEIIDNQNSRARMDHAAIPDTKWETLGVGEKPLELEPLSPKKQIEKKGVMGAAFDQVRDFKLDRRPIEEVIQKDLTGQLDDFAPNSKEKGLLNRAYDRLGKLVKENLLQDTTIALMMKNNAGTGPLIKWTVDQISRIDREYMAKTKQVTDATLKPFRQMFRDRSQQKALGEMWDKWSENIGVKDLGPSDFKSAKQWDVYQGFQKAHDQILKELNEKRAEAGFTPIQRIPSYFHSMWEGDYRVFGYDAAGNKKWATGYKTEAGALKDIKRLEKEHPDLRWEQSEVVRDKYGLIDLSAFEDALRVMSKDDPVTRAIQSTYRDILHHRGFGRTGLHKTGVLGFMGMEGGKQGLRSMEKSFDQYVNQAYRYLGNLEKQRILEDLQKIPLEQRKQIPQTIDFLYSYIHKARGAREEVWFDKLAAELTNAVGLGRSLPREAVRGMSQFATLYWLTTPKFLLSQTAQSLNALPKLMQEHGAASGASMFFEGWKNTISPDSTAKEAVKWASERQYLDPTIRNLINKDVFGGETPSGRMEAVKELASYPAAWIEHNAVRAPVFLMFEKALRDSIKEKEKRFEIAAEKTDYYMVNYGRVHAPAIYDKMGLIGEAARPLKQYSHNYIGQFAEYVSGAKNKGEFAPLAAFFGVQAAVGGLKGMILVAEATLAVNLINAMFDLDIPTPEKLLLQSNLHDLLIYGGMSSVLGVDVSASVAAPGLPSMLNFPPIEFTVGMVRDVGGFALKYLKGDETDYDRLRAWMAITPNAAHEYLKNAYTPVGEPTVNPNDPQLRGNYRRNEAERLWTNMTGAKMIDESRADALIRNVKKELLRDLHRRTDAVETMVDRLQGGKEIDQRLFEKYIKNGGDPANLSKAIIERMKEKQMTGVERHQRGTMTPQQAHKMEILQEFLEPLAPKDINKPMGFDPATGEIVRISDTITPVKDITPRRKDVDKEMEIDPDHYTPTYKDSDSNLKKELKRRLNKVPGEVMQDWHRRDNEVREKLIKGPKYST